MRLVAKPVPIDTTKLDAARVALRGWLMAVLAWFCEVVDLLPEPLQHSRCLSLWVTRAKAQVARDLRRSVTLTRRMVFIIATARLPASAWPRRFKRSERAPRPCVFAPTIRRLTSAPGGAHCGPLRARVARLQKLLDDLEPLIARVMHHMRAVLRAPRMPAFVAARFSEAHVTLAAPATASASTS